MEIVCFGDFFGSGNWGCFWNIINDGCWGGRRVFEDFWRFLLETMLCNDVKGLWADILGCMSKINYNRVSWGTRHSFTESSC